MTPPGLSPRSLPAAVCDTTCTREATAALGATSARHELALRGSSWTPEERIDVAPRLRRGLCSEPAVVARPCRAGSPRSRPSNPACALEVTRRTPVRPRAARSAKKVFHAGPVSLVAVCNHRTSRRPSALTPVAINTTTLPPSPHRAQSPQSSPPRPATDFDSEWIPRVFTSLSIRHVETPTRQQSGLASRMGDILTCSTG